MMTKNDIINFLKKNKQKLKQKYKITKIILFGSFANETNNTNSDIDIAIETTLKDYFLLYDSFEHW